MQSLTSISKRIASQYQAAYSDLPLSVWVIAGAMFVNRLGTMVVPFLSLYLTSQLHFTDSQAGWLLSAFGLGSIVGVFIAGRLITRVGAIRLQILLLCLSAPCFWLVPYVSHPMLITLALFALGAVNDGSRPAGNTAISRLATPDNRTQAFGLLRMAVNLGFSVGPAIGGFLALSSFTWLFWIDGGTTLLCGLLLGAYFGFGRQSGEDLSKEPADNSSAFTREHSPLADPHFIGFTGLIICTSIVFFQIHIAYPLYLVNEYGLTKPAIGGLFAVNTLLIVAFEMLLLHKVREMNKLRLIGLGASLSSFGLAMLLFGSGATLAVISMAFITLGEMLWMPLSASWVAQRATGRDDGRYMAWYTGSYSIAILVAPILGGTLYSFNPGNPWIMASIAAIVLPLGFWRLDALVGSGQSVLESTDCDLHAV